MLLANLLDRSLGTPSGLTPRRMSRFERSSDMALDEAGGESLSAPTPVMTPRHEVLPTPTARHSAEPPLTPQPTPPIQRIESVEHVRVEHIGKDPVAAPPTPPTIRTSEDAATPAPIISSRARDIPPIDAPKPRRARHAEAHRADPAPASPTPADPPIPPAEKIHVIEQRLHTLSRQWSRETRVEHTRETIRAADQPAPVTRRASPPPAQAAPMRAERLRPAIAAAPAPAPDPVVEVHIGRVELRATVAPPPRPSHRPATRPEGSLATYLHKRDGN